MKSDFVFGVHFAKLIPCYFNGVAFDINEDKRVGIRVILE